MAELKIIVFALALMLGVFIYGAIFHGSDLALLWIDKAAFAGIGAVAAHFFGPIRQKRGE